MTTAQLIAKYLEGAAQHHASARSFAVSLAMLKEAKGLIGPLPAPLSAIPLDHLTPHQAREIAQRLRALQPSEAA